MEAFKSPFKTHVAANQLKFGSTTVWSELFSYNWSNMDFSQTKWDPRLHAWKPRCPLALRWSLPWAFLLRDQPLYRSKSSKGFPVDEMIWKARVKNFFDLEDQELIMTTKTRSVRFKTPARLAHSNGFKTVMGQDSQGWPHPKHHHQNSPIVGSYSQITAEGR